MKPLLLIVFNFITGTACVIYGVKLMSCSLEKSNIKVIEKALGLFTRNLCTSFCSGTIMTALVQSSTAVTVVTVGLVNSGLLNLIQAAGIIYGANIGTTITAQFMSINFYGISWVLIIGGFLLRLAFKRTYTRQLGTAVIGMGIMLAGLEILDGGIHLVRQSHAASGIFLKYGEKPILAAFTGMSTAMLVQSSSAVTGLTIILFNGGLLGFEAAIALTLGANIGTCITAQAASIGTSLAARRTAWIHTIYNIIGVLAILPFLTPFAKLVINITQFLGQGTTYLVANAHTAFNVLSAAVFLPLTRYYVLFIKWLIPGRRPFP